MAAGDSEEISDAWGDARGLAVIGETAFIVAGNGILYRVDPVSGDYEELSNGWTPLAMVAHDGALYMFTESGQLFKINPEDGAAEELGTGWGKTTVAVSAGDHLLAICDGIFTRVEP